jgi:hypothetical protein
MMTLPPPNAADWHGWVWPVAALPDGRVPVVSQGFTPGERFKRDAEGHLVLDYSHHHGLDIMFQWSDGDPTEPGSDVAMFRTKPGQPRRGFIAPPGALVIAAGPGKIWAAGPSKLGLHVQIDHGIVGGAGGVNTFYQHLESWARDWKRGDIVEPGTVLGRMGGDPANVPHLRHLHFELWFPRKGTSSPEWPTDPEPYMRSWRRSTRV